MGLSKIRSIPKVSSYKAGTRFQPDQHILRSRNDNWPDPPVPEPNDRSKSKLLSYPHNSRSFSNPYDLLGLFLSSLDPAPIGATKSNFYLPLTAVYGRWCAQIAGNRIGGAGFVPCMFQCTWHKKDGERSQFFLGSSLAGYEARRAGTWELVVKRGRFNLLSDTLLAEGRYDFDSSPTLSNKKTPGTRFGNCAETHPFLKLMK